MKKASISDLHENFSRISKWLDDGETVHIIKRKSTIARIIPEFRKAKTLLGACPSPHPIPADIDDPVDVQWDAMKDESPI